MEHPPEAVSVGIGWGIGIVLGLKFSLVFQKACQRLACCFKSSCQVAKIVPLLGQCLRVMLDRTARQMSHLSTHLIELIEGIRAIGVVNYIFEVCNNDQNPYENRYN